MLYLNGEDAKQYHTENTAVALGKFDGIHLGHQMLIDGLLEEKKLGKEALVFTFGSAPNAILNKDFIQKSIYTKNEKVYYFSKFGIDVLLEYPFTKEFASFEAEDFVLEFLVKKLGVSSVYIGTDFRFGKDRSGGVSLLKTLGKKYNFEVNAIHKKKINNIIVSSTTIRDSLKKDFDFANKLLGNPYFVYGPVVHGRHLGHTIGFPTINQMVPIEKMIPLLGVYASRILIDGMYYKGISNLGMKPTVQNEKVIGLETYILDYKGDLYGKEVQTELLFFIRPEKKFLNIKELTKQINTDICIMLEKI